MRTPNWGPSRYESDAKPQGMTPDLSPLYGRMGLCLSILAICIFGYQWLMSDISGLYSSGDGPTQVDLTLEKTNTSFSGTLVLGLRNYLVLVDPTPPDSEEIALHFETSQDLINQGFPNRQVDLVGTLKDGHFSGSVVYGGKSRKVELTRDDLASIHMIMRAHLP
ncbi:MAG: hypothetical protein AB7V06_08520 [Candidatus Obscuribacterales bacterium]